CWYIIHSSFAKNAGINPADSNRAVCRGELDVVPEGVQVPAMEVVELGRSLPPLSVGLTRVTQGNELDESEPSALPHRKVADSYLVWSLPSFASFWLLLAVSLEPTAQARQEPKVPGRGFRINHLQRCRSLPAYGLAFILKQSDQVSHCTPGLRTDVSQGRGSFSADVLRLVLQCPGQCRHGCPGCWADFPQSRRGMTAEILVVHFQSPGELRHCFPGFRAQFSQGHCRVVPDLEVSVPERFDEFGNRLWSFGHTCLPPLGNHMGIARHGQLHA